MEIGRILNSYSINIWSVYQYFENIYSECNDNFIIPLRVFESIVEKIELENYSFHVEASPSFQRICKNFFVTHNGVVHINDPSNPKKYQYLGPFFSDSTIEKWMKLCVHTLTPNITQRYSSLGMKNNEK